MQNNQNPNGGYLWKSPKMEVYKFHQILLEQKHLLIAGASGSGKSVIVNGMIYTALHDFPSDKANGVKFVLLDPKRVELIDYKNLPHTVCYASEPDDMIKALQIATDMTDRRFKEMQSRHEKLYSGGHVYVIIDEYADLVTLRRKKVEPLVSRLTQIGRAAKVHVLLCTQNPLRNIITPNIRVCLDSIVGLRTASAQDSRNILRRTGLELLPPYGSCILQTPGGHLQQYTNIPMIPDEKIQSVINHWMNQARAAKEFENQK